eukprot:TRINITY_DN23462_c0_g1_i1.p1 TRINITY_DN23462_c0_g1~~TRINITY_DN23462_c0_g1_i1.p1  ORF type:complete len:314 (+),score=49.34 TRINITY_DN23462_c0_g1_i1:154-1095(+)
MGRKKIGPDGASGRTAQESLELKPFCYYCDKEFDTVKTLVQHQRTKHFNCSECGLKFDTITGLRVHMLNAYKRTMKEVPNSIPSRENPDIVVHGMEGLPKSIVEERTRKQLEEQAARNREKAAQREKAEKAAGEAAPSRPPAAEDATPPPPLPPAPDVSSSPPPLQQAAPEPAPAPAPPIVAPVQPPPVPAQPVIPRPPPPEPSAPAPMPRLSDDVSQLLNGNAPRMKHHVVPGIAAMVVPANLKCLHPVALQMLAISGTLHNVNAVVGSLAARQPPLAPTGPQPGFLGSIRNPWETGLEPPDKRPRIGVPAA